MRYCMLPSTRKEVSSKILKSHSAGVMALWILLLATAIIIPQGNLYSGLLPTAYARQLPEYGQQAEDEETSDQAQDEETSDQAQDEETSDQAQDEETSDQAQDEETSDQAQDESTQ